MAVAGRQDVPSFTSADWPLSRGEKKDRALRLYDIDVRTADLIISSAEAERLALHEELDKVKRMSKDTSTFSWCSHSGVPHRQSCLSEASTAAIDGPLDNERAYAGDVAESLRRAVEEAATVLTSLMVTGAPVQPSRSSPHAARPAVGETPPQEFVNQQRARSEGAARVAFMAAPVPWRPGRTPRGRRSVGNKLRHGPRGMRSDAASDSDSAGEADCELDLSSSRALASVCPRGGEVGLRRAVSMGKIPAAGRCAGGCTAEPGRVAASSALVSLESFIGEDVPTFPFGSLGPT